MSNVQIAIDWVEQNISRTHSGGVIAFPMFSNATKHDIRKIQQSLIKHREVANITINKQFAVVNLK